MSTCQSFPTQTRAQAIDGFCDEFPGFCSVSKSGVESVPSDVEKSILSDNVSTNDKNDCDGGFEFELTCPTACGTPQTTVSSTYRVVADAFGGGKECPYHDGFVMERTCPATPACPADCSGGDWDKTAANCPTSCGYAGGTLTATWTGATQAVGTGAACPTTRTITCPAQSPCAVPCVGSWTSPPCPTACGTPASNPSQTWSMTTPAQYGGSCPNTGPAPTYSCGATPACAVDCVGSWTSPPCPTACGTPASNPSQTWSMTTPAQYGGSCPNTGPAPTYSCGATPACAVDCVGSWTSPPCPTACGTPASNPSQTWSMTTPAQYGGSCPNTRQAPTYSCGATSKCVTPLGTYFALPTSTYEQTQLGIGKLANSWQMSSGYREVDINPNKYYFYTFTSPELIYLKRFGYEAHWRTDLLPSSVVWYKINPDGSWTELSVSESTSTKSNNYATAAFRASRGVNWRGDKCKGLVLQIRTTILNPNDSDRSDDTDYYLTFDVTGEYAGEFSSW